MSNVDGDGLSLPDDATIAAWKAEALQIPCLQMIGPTWSCCCDGLPSRADKNRVGWLPRRDDSAGTGALKTVLLVLLRQPHLVQHGATWPLDQLLAAIWVLKQGRVAPIFKPTKQKTGHPGTSNDHGRVMGMAARALSELIDGDKCRQGTRQHKSLQWYGIFLASKK